MKRFVANLFVALFVVGMVIVPAIHIAHCPDCGESHDAGACPVCRNAQMPVMSPAFRIVYIARPIPFVYVLTHVEVFRVASFRDPTHARAPPAC